MYLLASSDISILYGSVTNPQQYFINKVIFIVKKVQFIEKKTTKNKTYVPDPPRLLRSSAGALSQLWVQFIKRTSL